MRAFRAAVAALLLTPAAALAHAAPGGFVLLLPTGYWMAGGAASVAASFAVLAFLPVRGLARAARARLHMPLPSREGAARIAGWLSFTAFALVVAAGFAGPTDPLANPLPLTLWTAIWVGLTLATVLLGDLWSVLNPWRAPLALMRRARVGRLRSPPWLDRLGRWPAVAGLAGFGWFELIHLSPEDPRLLAAVVLGYWAVTFVLSLALGPGWLARGEFLTVFLALVARLAPLDWQERRLALSLPGARLLDGPPLARSEAAFVATALATVTFDGLSRSFAWLAFIGVNPLDFPGRSAVIAENMTGYATTVLAMAAAVPLAVLAGGRLAEAVVPSRIAVGRLALTLLPIALAYHASHYLTVALVNGQYWLAAIGDPFGLGWRLTGFGRHEVTTSFFHDRAAVGAIWTAQAAAVIAGHLLAVAAAHLIALDLWPDRRRAALGGLPLAVLMVGYTLLGLWLLAQPTGA